MGCDIHMYIEYRKKGREGEFASLGGRINPGRNYELFAAMAGVRTYERREVMFEPRGLPPDAGYEATGDNELLAIDGEDDKNVCSRQTAERWVASGDSKWVREGKWVTVPDWHSHSWLTCAEYQTIIDAKTDSAEPKYRAILAAMKQLESDGYDARIVFWFDN